MASWLPNKNKPLSSKEKSGILGACRPSCRVGAVAKTEGFATAGTLREEKDFPNSIAASLGLFLAINFL